MNIEAIWETLSVIDLQKMSDKYTDHTRIAGVYFSGTGNSRYAAECFCRELDKDSKVLSIEDHNVVSEIRQSDTLVFAYPVQYSTVPKILRDFITNNSELWTNKKVFIIATMGLFSGDGSGILGRLLHAFGAEVIGGLHLKMPDSIGDEKALKRPLDTNRELIRSAESKIKESVRLLKEGTPTREGLGPLYQMAGLFGQRLYFGHKTKEYSSKLKINSDKCVGCGLCVKLCPMNNISLAEGKAVPAAQCTMCYRCINKCPKQAITLLGKKVIEQSVIEKYV